MRASKMVMVVLSTLLGLLIAEGVVRLLPQSFIEYRAALAGDPLLGIPPSTADIRVDFPQQAKPENVYRIVVLGDSQTVSVRSQSSYAKRLESLLNNDDLIGKRVEVHNAGAPGHSHYQYYLSLDRRLKQYDPDLVIVGFYIGNDFLDLYRNDDRPNLSFDGRVFTHKDPVFYKFYDPEGTGIGLVESSRLLAFVQLMFRRAVGYEIDRVRIMWGIGKQGGKGNVAAARYVVPIIRGYFIHQHIFRQSMNQILFFDRFPAERAVIDRINEKVTRLMKETADENGMELLYVPIPTKLQVEPDSDPAVLQQTLQVSNLDPRALKVEDDLYSSFVSLLDEHGINYVAVTNRLKKRANRGVLYDDTYHLTEESHEIIAKALYDVVAPMVKSSSASGSALNVPTARIPGNPAED